MRVAWPPPLVVAGSLRALPRPPVHQQPPQVHRKTPTALRVRGRQRDDRSALRRHASPAREVVGLTDDLTTHQPHPTLNE